jgi:hypothetical protein
MHTGGEHLIYPLGGLLGIRRPRTADVRFALTSNRLNRTPPQSNQSKVVSSTRSFLTLHSHLVSSPSPSPLPLTYTSHPLHHVLPVSLEERRLRPAFGPGACDAVAALLASFISSCFSVYSSLHRTNGLLRCIRRQTLMLCVTDADQAIRLGLCQLHRHLHLQRKEGRRRESSVSIPILSLRVQWSTNSTRSRGRNGRRKTEDGRRDAWRYIRVATQREVAEPRRRETTSSPSSRETVSDRRSQSRSRRSLRLPR